jgi:hypothetical protein
MLEHKDDKWRDDSGPKPYNRGRRSIDSELTFPVAMSKAVVWLLVTMMTVVGALLVWLCVGQLENSKTLVRMEERSAVAIEQNKIFHQELERLTLTDNRLSLELKNLQIAAARHGWKETE